MLLDTKCTTRLCGTNQHGQPVLNAREVIVVLVAILIGVASDAVAQQKSAAPDRPVVLIGGDYGTPMRLFGTVGVLIAAPQPMEPGGSPKTF